MRWASFRLFHLMIFFLFSDGMYSSSFVRMAQLYAYVSSFFPGWIPSARRGQKRLSRKGRVPTETSQALSTGDYSRAARRLSLVPATLLFVLISSPVFATAPSFIRDAQSLTVPVNSSITFEIFASGSYPLVYQWQLLPPGSGAWTNISTSDPTYSGANGPQLYSSNVGVGLNGISYRCIVSNAEGSITSSAALLGVFVPSAVSRVRIVRFPPNPVPYNGYLQLEGRYSGDGPVTIQWFRDGVPISEGGGGTLTIPNATPAVNGSYSVTITNAGGSMSSVPDTVIVSPQELPSITTQPVSVTVEKGLPFSLTAAAVGSAPLTFQWYRDGQALVGETYNFYNVSDSTDAHNGTYTFVATNQGGSATSQPVNVVIFSGALPRITYPTYSIDGTINSGYPLSLTVEATGAKPLTYQWLKNGVVIPGAVANTYSKYPAGEDDAGIYTVQISNEAGVVRSPPYILTWAEPNAVKPWLDAHRLGNVMYFLAQSPGRIMRYDLANETWLSVVNLEPSKQPTGFLPTTAGTFVAYGTSIVRRSTDLQTETPVVTAASDVRYFFERNNLVYFVSAYNTYSSYDRTSLAPGPTGDLPGELIYNGLSGVQPVLSATTGKGYTSRPYVSPNDIISFTFDSSGAIVSSTDSPYHGDFTVGEHRFVSPDGNLVYDGGSAVYNAADLTYAGSMGSRFSELAFMDNGSVVALQGKQLVLHAAASLAEQGRRTLSASGVNMTSQGQAIYVFSAPLSGTTTPVVNKVTTSDFTLVSGPAPLDPASTRLSVDEAFVDPAGVVHVVSRVLGGIARWDTQTHGFLSSLPLLNDPVALNYAPAARTLVLAYPGGRLTHFQFNTNNLEKVFGGFSYSGSLMKVVAMDDLALVSNYSPNQTTQSRLVVGSDGVKKYFSDATDYGDAQTWDTSSRRLYTNSNQAVPQVGYVTVPTTGIMPASFEGTYAAAAPMLPFRVSTTSSELLAANGKILTKDLAALGDLGAAMVDGVWLPDGLYTIRTTVTGTQVEKWSRTGYAKIGGLGVAGKPVRILRLSDTRLVAVTLVEGYLAFHLVATDLSSPETFLSNPNAVGLPVITQHPLSKTASVGDTVTLAVSAVGSSPLNYRWQVSASGTAGWSDVGLLPAYSGTSTNQLRITATSDLDGLFYRCVVSNQIGTIPSGAASLTVTATAVSIVAQPVSVTANFYTTFFSVTAKGSGPLSYRWQVLPPSGGSWTDLTDNATYHNSDSSLLSVNASPDLSGYSYRCRVTNNINSVVSNAATLTESGIIQPPSIAVQPVPVTVDPDANAVFSVTAFGAATLSYEWQVSLPGSGQWQDLSNGGGYAGVTTSVLTVTASIQITGNIFRCVVTNSSGSVTSAGAVLTVAGVPVITLVSPRRSVVAPRHNLDLTLSAVGAGTLSYQWFQNGHSIAGANGTSLSLIDVDRTAGGYYYADVTGEFGTQRSATLFVIVAPAATRVVRWGSDGQIVNYPRLDNVVSMPTSGNGGIGIDRDGRVVTASVPAQTGVTAIPTGLSDVVDVAVSQDYGLALKSDGTVVSWGSNSFGATAVPAGLTDVVGISANWYHAVAVKSNGTVVAWGGQNSGDARGIAVPSDLNTAIEVVASFSGSLALKADGTVRGWGSLVNAGFSDIASIKGSDGSIALTKGGLIVAPGSYYLAAGISDVVQISGGGDLGLALNRDGTVVGWGTNFYSASHVPSNLSNVLAVAAGQNFSAALVDMTPASDLAFVSYPTVKQTNVGAHSLVNFRVRNIGSQGWGYFHSLVVRDTSGNEVASAALNGPAPGDYKDVSLYVTLPMQEGRYSYQVQGSWGSEKFGRAITISFDVRRSGQSDFNGDGQADILWQNIGSGDHGIWVMNGTAPSAWINLPVIALDWRIVGTGDFNGDGQTDILWENVGSGDRGIWIMNGTVPAAWINLPSIALNWRIVGTGDFNGDGQTDILWENVGSGDRGMWIMNGTVPAAWINLPSIALNWLIVGTGDFNGDGQTDILWENVGSGDRGLWIMNGTVPAAWINLPSIALNWRIAGTGDFNNDGQTDILWENEGSGDRGMWIMNGTVPTAWINLPTLTLDWRIAQ